MELDVRTPDPELLTQEQVGRVLAQFAEESGQTRIHRPGGGLERRPQLQLPAHDFTSPAFLSENQWRQLRVIHKEWAQALSHRLSNYLRLEVTVQLGKLQTITYRDWLQSLDDPSHFTLFKLEPLRGVCLLQIPPHLGLAVVDRLLGGPGEPSSLGRELSDIESALLDQALLHIVNEWCQPWNKSQELHPSLLGHETSSRYLQSSPPETTMLIVGLEARIGNCQEELSLVFPCSTVEPLFQSLGSNPAATPSPAPSAPPPRPKWNPEFNKVVVPMAAESPERRLSARQLTQVKVGDVLDWEPAAAAQVRLRLGPMAKFVGRLGTRNGRWAVEITGVLPASSQQSDL
jgi:flagellar motor switch protein FliM